MEVSLTQLFDEPVVGSVELIDEYDKLWATILDDKGDELASSDSMTTTKEG